MKLADVELCLGIAQYNGCNCSAMRVSHFDVVHYDEFTVMKFTAM